jgi:hypothetical protein
MIVLRIGNTAGFGVASLNVPGAMQNRLSPQEAEARRTFREETGQDFSAA